MKLRKPVLFLLLIVSTKCFSQSEEARQVTDVAKLTFLEPGIGYEKAVGKLQTLYVRAFLHTSFSVGSSDAFGPTSSIGFNPALGFQYRYYYNYTRRHQKGKSTERNSMNYISPVVTAYLSQSRLYDIYYAEEDSRLVNTIGMVWGLQRNYKKRFSLDMNFGLGYLITTGTKLGRANEPVKGLVGELSPLSNINLGFWLNKRK